MDRRQIDVTFEVADWVLVTADQTYRAVGELSISIVDDAVEEEGESLRLFTNHETNPPYRIQLPPDFVLAILDNDGEPVYALSAGRRRWTRTTRSTRRR